MTRQLDRERQQEPPTGPGLLKGAGQLATALAGAPSSSGVRRAGFRGGPCAPRPPPRRRRPGVVEARSTATAPGGPGSRPGAAANSGDVGQQTSPDPSAQAVC